MNANEQAVSVEFVTLEEVKSLPLHLDAGGVAKVHGALNEIGARIFNRAVETALLSMPEFSVRLLRKTAEMERMRDQFLAVHGDLAARAEFFEALAQVEAEHPGWPYDQMLEEAAKRGRAMLRAGQTLDALAPAGGQTDKPPTLEQADDLLNGAL